MHRRMLSRPPLAHATNGSSQDSLRKFSSFSPTVAYILLIVFVIFFFVVGLVFFYIKKHSSSNSEAGDIHGPAVSDSVASRSLTMVTVVAETAGECTVCLEKVGEGEEVQMIAHCKHIFHQNCIDRWLENQVTCPVCRYSERSGEEELVTVGGGEEEDAEVSVTNLEIRSKSKHAITGFSLRLPSFLTLSFSAGPSDRTLKSQPSPPPSLSLYK
ncbi:hypothetical protein VNO80_25783 [Phaseolus coccineus]|uniref:RING-type domain-containing protein n=1 Tax=Phaseolus coccineus TaxID=3886 RepID=A0AAN9QPB3_PHACN